MLMKYSPNSSSIAMMISTWSKLSSPRSFVKWEHVSSYEAEFTPALETRQTPISDCSDGLLSSTDQVDNSSLFLSYIACNNKKKTDQKQTNKKSQVLSWPSQGLSCRRAWGRTWRGLWCSLGWAAAGHHTVWTTIPPRGPEEGVKGQRISQSGMSAKLVSNASI